MIALTPGIRRDMSMMQGGVEFLSAHTHSYFQHRHAHTWGGHEVDLCFIAKLCLSGTMIMRKAPTAIIAIF